MPPRTAVRNRSNFPCRWFRFPGHPAGMYTIKLNDAALRSGIALDVRQPRAALAMKLKPSTIQHLHGNPSTYKIKLEDDGQPVTGAAVQSYLLRPDGSQGRGVATKGKLGGGRYRADVTSNMLSQRDATGAYSRLARRGAARPGTGSHSYGTVAPAAFTSVFRRVTSPMSAPPAS